MDRYTSFVMLLVAGALAACSGAGAIPDAGENRALIFEPGAPNFDMEAVSVLRDGETGLDVYSAIPHASLVYVKRGDRYEATYELLVRILQQGKHAPVLESTFTDSLSTSSFGATQSFDGVHRQDFVALPSGAYTVEIALEDAESGSRIVRRQDVEISDVLAGEPLLGDVLLKVSRDAGGFHPAVSIHLPGGYDSLRAVTELYNLPEKVDTELTLVRFTSDTTVALPPFYFTPGPFSLPYRGVDYQDGDTIQVSRRRLENAGEQVSIEFSLPVLEKGVYAVELHVQGGDVERVSRRHFAVMSPTFPRISSLDEMIDALQYIAREKEWTHIAAAATPEERRRRFDAFWAGLVPNREAAALLLENYYSRVEDANILYSTHKEGWKTDFGMIYIVFGAPSYTETHHIRHAWYYFETGATLSRRLPPYIFRRSTAYGHGGLFENYILQRDVSHEHEWRKRIEKWRDGVAL